MLQIFGSLVKKICKNARVNFEISVCLSVRMQQFEKRGKILLEIDIDFAKFLSMILLIFFFLILVI